MKRLLISNQNSSPFSSLQMSILSIRLFLLLPTSLFLPNLYCQSTFHVSNILISPTVFYSIDFSKQIRIREQMLCAFVTKQKQAYLDMGVGSRAQVHGTPVQVQLTLRLRRMTSQLGRVRNQESLMISDTQNTRRLVELLRTSSGTNMAGNQS